MKLEDAIMAVISKQDGVAPPSKEMYEVLCLSIEIGLRAAYKVGGEFVWKDEPSTVLGTN